MPEVPGSVLVVGGGFAAGHAVTTLRAEGFRGGITVVGAEPHQPYERPPLSKDYLQGKAERDSVFVHPSSWYSENDVELRLGASVTAIDAATRTVTVADGGELSADAILVVTGARPRAVPLPGADMAGVVTLRTLDDSEALAEHLRTAKRIAIIGAGWIGLEIAAAARLADVEVTVLERAPLPLVAVLGPEVAQVFADLHTDHGVTLRMGVAIAEIVGEDGRATGVRLEDGEVVPADLVLGAVGAVPNVELAQAAGLDVDNGIVVDAALRASAPGIWAAGDVASAYHPVLDRQVRVEHWDNAKQQGAAAARSILGQDVSYDRLPYFYTDQYDLGMEYAGFVPPGGYDEVVLRGDVPGREFVAFWRSEGRVLAGMGVNIWDAMDPVRALVTSRRVVHADRLRDTSVPLADV
jgi:3-phenylpropionate/trans-cinnamate dioxygenase ferredoxin reductase subunit